MKQLPCPCLLLPTGDYHPWSFHETPFAPSCSSFQVAQPPCHSCTTFVLETHAVSASLPPASNLYGASSEILMLHGICHVSLNTFFNPQQKCLAARSAGLQSCVAQTTLSSCFKSAVRYKATARPRSNASAKSAKIKPLKIPLIFFFFGAGPSKTTRLSFTQI